MVKNLIENAHKENHSFDSTFTHKMEHPRKFFQKMQDAIEKWHREMNKKVDRLFNHWKMKRDDVLTIKVLPYK